MADIFDTGISQASPVKQGIGDPSFAPPSRAAGVSVNPEDIYNLRAGRRVEQLEDQAAAERAARQAQEQRIAAHMAKEQAAAAKVKQLNNLTSGLINKYAEIDTNISNPIERNRLKREADLIAIQVGGKENREYINDIIGKLKTKREARPDGLVNIIGSNGEILGVEASSREAVMDSIAQDNLQEIEEVFDEGFDNVANLIEKDAATTNLISNETVNKITTDFKNEAGRMKRISLDYHTLSNELPTSQLPTLKANAQAEYMQSISKMFSTFTSRDMLKAIKSGKGINRDDIEIAAQSLRRDVINEISSQRVPVDIQDIETYINTTISNMRTTYEETIKSDVLSVEVAEKQARLRNDLAKEHMRAKLNTAELEAMTPMLDFMTKTAAASESFAQASMQASTLGLDAKETYGRISKGMVSLSDSLLVRFENQQKHMAQSSFDFNDYMKQVDKIENTEDARDVFEKLAKITNHTDGWILAPKVKKVVGDTTNTIIQKVEEGKIPREEALDMFEQLARYQEHAKAMMRRAGYANEQEFLQEADAGLGFFGTLRGLFGFPASSTEEIKIPKELAQRGGGNE